MRERYFCAMPGADASDERPMCLYAGFIFALRAFTDLSFVPVNNPANRDQSRKKLSSKNIPVYPIYLYTGLFFVYVVFAAVYHRLSLCRLKL